MRSSAQTNSLLSDEPSTLAAAQSNRNPEIRPICVHVQPCSVFLKFLSDTEIDSRTQQARLSSLFENVRVSPNNTQTTPSTMGTENLVAGSEINANSTATATVALEAEGTVNSLYQHKSFNEVTQFFISFIRFGNGSFTISYHTLFNSESTYVDT